MLLLICSGPSTMVFHLRSKQKQIFKPSLEAFSVGCSPLAGDGDWAVLELLLGLIPRVEILPLCLASDQCCTWGQKGIFPAGQTGMD